MADSIKMDLAHGRCGLEDTTILGLLELILTNHCVCGRIWILAQQEAQGLNKDCLCETVSAFI